jgi:hypothetical protein
VTPPPELVISVVTRECYRSYEWKPTGERTDFMLLSSFIREAMLKAAGVVVRS